MKSLQIHHSYTHCWDYFSKALILKATLEKQGSFTHLVSSSAEAKKYEKISQDLDFRYYNFSSHHDISVLENRSSSCIYSLQVEDIQNFIITQTYGKELLLKKWAQTHMEECIKWLQSCSYEFHEFEKTGSYMRQWDILRIFFPHQWKLEVSFWGDEIESIHLNGSEIETYTIYSIAPFEEDIKKSISLLSFLQDKGIYIIADNLQFHHSYEEFANTKQKISCMNTLTSWESELIENDYAIEGLHIENLEALKDTLSDKRHSTIIYTRHSSTMKEFLRENNFGHIELKEVKNHILTSFTYREKKVSHVYICDDIISKIFIKKRVRKKLSADIDLLLKIQKGDYIVHIDHGIGIFTGIIEKQLGETKKEYLEIAYKDKDKLFVPITEVQRVSKYVGSENPQLTPLSGKVWEKKMQKIHEDIREIAEWILQNFAERKLRKWNSSILSEGDTHDFQSLFPYTYTIDQASAIEDIFTDMKSDRNMDRLIVWDVWFWKTEIAFNAAYCAMKNKKQVLFISPLVVLTHEHYEKAKQRFQEFPFKIEVLTRLQSQAHATKVLKWLVSGEIDMVIGTHRLLWDKLVCKNLGLMIVDEEHKFWVGDKEKIKNLKSDIDILSLSATPIPRSLNLALSWVRSISLLKTPPGGRKSIDTSVLRFNEALIQSAWEREFRRWWQIFFVHNRVANIEVFKKKLTALFPKKKIIITHGQLPGEELENRILDFKNKKYDILLSTTVIENGIDFSNVNTIFINECQQFWISQIHQLRWRVWRSQRQWYCYLLYKKEQLDETAAKRIQTIVDYSYLWAGFELAMKDLEIRWGWDILGVRQSGQAKEIWVSLFLKMLEEKISELKEGEKPPKKKYKENCKIDLMISASISSEHFLSETDKLNFYREIETIESIEDLEYVKNSFLENKDLSRDDNESENLFSILECQIYAKQFMITHIKKVWINYELIFHKDAGVEKLKEFLILDRLVSFVVTSAQKLRCPAKGFAKDILFIEYLLQLFTKQWGNPKIKLKRKAD